MLNVLINWQALPQVTVVVGCVDSSSNMISVLTTAEMTDEPKQVEFAGPTISSALTPGKPHWANYVKGVIQCFKCKLSRCQSIKRL